MEPSNRTGIRYASPLPKRDKRKSRLHLTAILAVFALLAVLILTVSVVASVARRPEDEAPTSSGRTDPSVSSGDLSKEPISSSDPNESGNAVFDTSAASDTDWEESSTALTSEEPSFSSSVSSENSEESSDNPSDGTSFESSDSVSDEASDIPSEEPSETEPEVVTSFYAYTKPIPYKTVYEETDDMDEGETKLKTAGVDGEMKYTVKQIFTDGELTYEDVWSEDIMKKPVDEVILKGTRRNITYDSYLYTKTVEYKTEYKYDTTLPEGKEVVEQEGKNGEVQYTVKQTFVNGKLTDEDIVAEDILTPVQHKIVRKGVGGVVETATGKTVAYSYRVSVRTTCYYGGEDGGHHSATGKDLAYGMIAVDPDVIPLRSKLYIDFGADSYDGYFTAEDIGGGIKGDIIDVYFPTYSDAKAFNAVNRTATVYILSE